MCIHLPKILFVFDIPEYSLIQKTKFLVTNVIFNVYLKLSYQQNDYTTFFSKHLKRKESWDRTNPRFIKYRSFTRFVRRLYISYKKLTFDKLRK